MESVKEKYMEVDMVIQEENVIIVKLSLLSSSCLSGCCSCFKLFHIVTWGNFQSQFRVIVLLSLTNWSMT